MTVTEVTAKRDKVADDLDRGAPSRPPESRTATKRSVEIRPFLITLAAVALAGLLGWAMWSVYMEGPWTRNATVRAYVVTMAPEVAGRIVELHVVDNKFVRKGDLLLVIDPTNYRIAVSQSEAAVQQAQANVQNIEAQMNVQQAQINASEAQLRLGRAALVFAQQQADRYQKLAKDGFGTVQNAQQFTSQLHQQEATVQSAQENLNQTLRQVQTLKAQRLSAEAGLAQANAQLNQAQVNLERTRIIAPVDGYVTNLLAQLGDYVNVGVNTISLVDANSFWVDGYFEETTLAPIRVGDSAQIKLMGHGQIVRGHVDSIARAINVANAQPNSQGVANVNPIFTWVRLAQRIPVRIHIDEVPPNVVLSAGMTATVEINDRGRLAALSLPSGDCVVGPYDRPLMGINRARSAHSLLNEARSLIQLDFSEVIANETVTNFENLNANIAHDLRIVWERVVNEDVTVALEDAENRVRDWSETVVLTPNPPDHGPMMLPMSFSARAKLFGLAICTALIALILAIFLDIL